MFKNEDKSEIIYLYDFVQGGYIQKFPTKLDYLKFVASNLFWVEKEHKWDSEYFIELNMGTDTYSFTDYREYSETVFYTRRYLFIDELDRIIDPRIDKMIICQLREKGLIDYKCCWKRKRKSKYLVSKVICDFRKDPVPHTSINRCQVYKSIKIMSEVRCNSDIDSQNFVRAKRKVNTLKRFHFENDIRSRYKSSSWKDCTKKRKQWM